MQWSSDVTVLTTKGQRPVHVLTHVPPQVRVWQAAVMQLHSLTVWPAHAAMCSGVRECWSLAFRLAFVPIRRVRASTSPLRAALCSSYAMGAWVTSQERIAEIFASPCSVAAVLSQSDRSQQARAHLLVANDAVFEACLHCARGPQVSTRTPVAKMHTAA